MYEGETKRIAKRVRSIEGSHLAGLRDIERKSRARTIFADLVKALCESDIGAHWGLGNANQRQLSAPEGARGIGEATKSSRPSIYTVRAPALIKMQPT